MSTSIPALPGLESNPGLCCERSVTNRCGMLISWNLPRLTKDNHKASLSSRLPPLKIVVSAEIRGRYLQNPNLECCRYAIQFGVQTDK